MKISSFFKPVTRQFAKLSRKQKGASSAVSRTSSSSSTWVPNHMSLPSSVPSQDSFSSTFALPQSGALYQAYASALQAGLANPSRYNGHFSFAEEMARSRAIIATRRTAQSTYDKAKNSMVAIESHMLRAEREHGVNSPEVNALKGQMFAATQALDKAAAELFTAQIACCRF